MSCNSKVQTKSNKKSWKSNWKMQIWNNIYSDLFLPPAWQIVNNVNPSQSQPKRLKLNQRDWNWTNLFKGTNVESLRLHLTKRLSPIKRYPSPSKKKLKQLPLKILWVPLPIPPSTSQARLAHQREKETSLGESESKQIVQREVVPTSRRAWTL